MYDNVYMHTCMHVSRMEVKGTRYKSCFGRFKTDITHDRVLGISVNIPTKTCCPRCVFCLYTVKVGSVYTFCRIHSLPVDHQSILIKEHLMKKATILCNTIFVYFSEQLHGALNLAYPVDSMY